MFFGYIGDDPRMSLFISISTLVSWPYTKLDQADSVSTNHITHKNIWKENRSNHHGILGL